MSEITDLEQSIMKCWSVVDDIDEVYKFIGDDEFFQGIDPKHADKIANLLLGLNSLYEVKFNSMWNDFEAVCREHHQRGKQRVVADEQ
jgi:hypothetical protein